MRNVVLTCACGLVCLAAPLAPAAAQSSTEWAAHLDNRYRVVPNVTYGVAGGTELKLDVYQRRDVDGPQPTVLYMHGGFWAIGSKETSVMALMPWLEMGWNVVNVEYRLARVALAPAAVEDCLCSLRFIAAQAETYNVDTDRIVLTGQSAGGHLSLTTGVIPESARLDLQCAGAPLPPVAAIVNWYGVTDVADVVDGPNRSNLAVQWLGSLPNWQEVARRVSPLAYVRAGLSPILTVHGDGSSHECMHSLRQRQVGHAVIEVPDVVTGRPESVGPVDDELGFVVQAFDRAVIDGHAEVVKDVALVAAQHPGKVAQGRQA